MGENESEVVQSCSTLCDPIDCSLSGSSVHGIFQAIVLEWVAISFSRGSSQPRARTQVSRIVECRFTVWATREVLGRKVMTNLDGMLKSRDITVNKCLSSQGYGFSIVMYGCESWTIKKAECRRIDAFELWCWRRLLRVPLDFEEIQPVHPKGHQSWVFIGRTDVEAETPKSWLIGKDPDAGKDWGQEEKRKTEDEMAGWHHQLNGHELKQTPGDSGG